MLDSYVILNYASSYKLTFLYVQEKCPLRDIIHHVIQSCSAYPRRRNSLFSLHVFFLSGMDELGTAWNKLFCLFLVRCMIIDSTHVHKKISWCKYKITERNYFSSEKILKTRPSWWMWKFCCNALKTTSDNCNTCTSRIKTKKQIFYGRPYCDPK
jgi:hypothetical protein